MPSSGESYVLARWQRPARTTTHAHAHPYWEICSSYFSLFFLVSDKLFAKLFFDKMSYPSCVRVVKLKNKKKVEKESVSWIHWLATPEYISKMGERTQDPCSTCIQQDCIPQGFGAFFPRTESVSIEQISTSDLPTTNLSISVDINHRATIEQPSRSNHPSKSSPSRSVYTSIDS